MTVIRDPAVAGKFYPDTTNELNSALRGFLDDVHVPKGPAPKALIVPHAGYVYSGPVAATAYARLRPFHHRYTRVVLLGPCHQVAFDGIALSGADVFRTPLGDVPVDKQVIANLDLPEVKVLEEAHRFEHSLEVHLPFLQCVIETFKLVPLVVGNVASDTVAQLIDTLWGGPETLIVVSSDLSHYLSYDEARTTDKSTSAAIENLQGQDINHEGACGATSIRGLLLATKRRGMAVTTLDLRNSGDTTGDQSRVVGYGAWIFLENNAA